MVEQLPFCTTGYGMTTASCARNLKAMGHDVAIYAFYGLEGAKVDWGNIPIYPNTPRDWGVQNAMMFYEDWKADIFITLIDVWVQGGLDGRIKWVPYMPVDHDPAPPLVVQTLKNHPGLVKPIVQSLHGQRMLKDAGIDAYHIPPPTNCHLFRPQADWRKEGRTKYEWQDKFVIGTVGTNHSERKNWNASLKAVKILESRHPGEIVYYMHTNPVDPRGIDLNGLRVSLGLEKFTFFPNLTHLEIGIEQELLVRAYNVMDVFLLPSKGEGFGVPLIEAQACGVPIVTTKCTAQTELMGGGWFIEKLTPVWTGQRSYQFECDPEEVAERLEQAYQAKKDGSIAEVQRKAREKALEYDDTVIFEKFWPHVLADIEKKLKEPKNCEGVQPWRINFIPKTCTPRKVLDAGCGLTVPYKKQLEHLGEYVGVDVRANGETPDILKADVHSLPFSNKEFGFVWASEVLEHTDDPKKVVDELKRVGVHGVILFSTPENPWFKGDPEHKQVTAVRYTTTATGDGLITW